MNKAELIKEIAVSANLTKVNAKKAVDALKAVISQTPPPGAVFQPGQCESMTRAFLKQPPLMSEFD